MNILLASSEVFPYSKTGGLADMVGALSKALGADGNNVTGDEFSEMNTRVERPATGSNGRSS